jgi:hypothetical protein
MPILEKTNSSKHVILSWKRVLFPCLLYLSVAMYINILIYLVMRILNLMFLQKTIYADLHYIWRITYVGGLHWRVLANICWGTCLQILSKLILEIQILNRWSMIKCCKIIWVCDFTTQICRIESFVARS